MKPYEAKNIQELIVAIKEENNWATTREAAKGLGFSHSLVAEMEAGGTTQDRRVLVSLAKAAKMPLVRVLEITGFVEAQGNLPPDVQAIVDLLKQAERENPNFATVLKRLLYAQLSEALDLPAELMEKKS